MSVLEKLFGMFRGPPARTPEESGALITRKVEEAKARLRPCLTIEPGDAAGGSWLGGAPTLDAATPWPPHRDDSLLDFLAQIDLAEVRSCGGPDWLPAEGRLMFFYDVDDPGAGPTS
jgi:uncharacterized protein YwqG